MHLQEMFITSGRQVFEALLEEDRSALCGRKNQPDVDRQAYRYGFDEGQVVLGGRKIRHRKPRVRSVDGREIELPTWRHVSDEDPLAERTLEQLLVGVSTRGYSRSLEPVGEELETVGVSRSSVSRRFVARTTRQVEEFLARSLEGLDLPVILLDGTNLGDHVLITAVGIDRTGKKHVLGVVEGSTESEEVCRSLLASLIERGLVVERVRLFVIDGGKGLRKAIRAAFGDGALVQRCQVHKMRNILDHLPESRRAWTRATVRRAWASEVPAAARRKLLDLARQLEGAHPGAAASIREGLDETLTVLELGLSGALARTLCTTNPIENLQGALKRVTRNVKRWTGGSMALRWAVTALIEAEKKFRRIKGHREMPHLLAALEVRIKTSSLDSGKKVA
jgi:transposase-like protein